MRAAPLTVIQLVHAGAAYVAERVANDLIKRHQTSPRAILHCIEVAGRSSWAMASLRAYCERATTVRGHDDSPAARDLGAILIAAGVPPFVTQHYVPVDGHDYFLDFAWPDRKVGLEYQGWRDHGTTRGAFDNDTSRRDRLTAAGWRILEATSAMTHEAVVRWVLATLAAASRFPSS